MNECQCDPGVNTIMTDITDGADDDVVPIDGSTLEGGGQVVRSSLSLAWVRGRPLVVRNIRAGRPKPGLGNQHCAGAQLSARLQGFALSGNHVGSKELRATRHSIDYPLAPIVSADATTAGAVTLMLQAALPPLLFCASRSSSPELQLLGGTDVPFSPPAAHTQLVLAPLLARMGATLDLHVLRRAFMPDVGEVRCRASLSAPPSADGPRQLRPIELVERGRPCRVRGLVVASAGGADAAAAYLARLTSALKALAPLQGVREWELVIADAADDGAPAPPPVESSVEGRRKKNKGGKRAAAVQVSAQVAIDTDTACVLSANALTRVP